MTTRGRVLRGLTTATVLALCATSGIGSAGAATGRTVTITRVDGRVPGATDREVPGLVGADTLDVRGTALVDPPPIADAGTSPRVAAGTVAPLTGYAAYGTPGNYRFAWTYQGSAARFDKPGSQNTGFSTTGLPAGTYPVVLTVTDASDRTATDTVLVAVTTTTAGATIKDYTYTSKPGVPAETVDPTTDPEGANVTVPFTLAPETSDVTVSVSWPGAASDFDLYVKDPGGATAGTSAGSTNPEVVTLPGRQLAGTWNAQVNAYTTPGEAVRVLVKGTTVAGPSIPTLSTAGPYQFASTATQRLTATVAGGTAPLTTAWDLDGDAIFESTGTSVVAHYPVGTTALAAVKVTDASGFEVKEVVPVKVLPAGEAPTTVPIVVVGVTDSGVNVYHRDWRATTYPDPRVLALTNNFTKDPAEYIVGYPTGTPAIPITLTDTTFTGYFPAADAALWTRDNVPAKSLRWIPGTKIVGVYDTDAASGATAAADTIPILDEDSHGTASASVAVGNIYGFCKTCLLVAAEGLDESYIVNQPWIDISSNSFGALTNLGFAGTISDPSIPKPVAESGKLTLFAAGNGNENAFITPEQTYTNENLGPSWSIRVGAVERGSRKPIVGTGKPVDVSSFGSGDIPSAGNTGYDTGHQHSGTSAATPYTSGVFGTVLTTIRERLGDAGNGQNRFAEGGAIAKGTPLSTSPYLYDGVLTAAEIREAVFKTAQHDTSAGSSALPTTTPSNDNQYAIEGYGIVEPASGARAIDVLLGRNPLPTRPAAEEDFFARDKQTRDEIWGTWNGGGTNSRTQSGAPAPTTPPDSGGGIPGQTFAARFTRPTEGTVVDPAASPTIVASGPVVFPPPTYSGTAVKLYAHRPKKVTGTADCTNDVEVLSTAQALLDTECSYTFQAAGGQLGIVDSFPLDATQLTDRVLTGGTATGVVRIGATGANSRVELQARLVATVGGTSTVVGSQNLIYTAVTANTDMPFSFPVAASAAGAPTAGLRFDVAFVSSAGVSSVRLNNSTFINVPLQATSSLPAKGVRVAVDGGTPVTATLGAGGTTWSVPALSVASLAPGTHTLTVVPTLGGDPTGGSGDTVHIVVGTPPPAGLCDGVEVQLTREGDAPVDGAWKPAIDDAPGFSIWHTSFDVSTLPSRTRTSGAAVAAAAAAESGRYTVHSRLKRNNEVASTDQATFTRAVEDTPPTTVPELPLGALPALFALLCGGSVVVLRRRRSE